MDATGHILIARGANAAGRRVVRAVTQAGGRPSVLDRRTSVSGAPAAKVDLHDPAATGHAIADLVRGVGPITGVVLLPSPDRDPRADGRPGHRWEHALAEELVEVATVLRAVVSSVGSRPIRIVRVDGAQPQAAGRPAQRSADDIVSALIRGLVAELAPHLVVLTAPPVTRDATTSRQLMSAIRPGAGTQAAGVRMEAAVVGRPEP